MCQCDRMKEIKNNSNLHLKEGTEMAKNERFEKVYSQGSMNVSEIWVDKETGVNYLYHACGNSGGLTPLLNREGKPVISPIV